MDTLARHILERKGQRIVTIEGEASVWDAVHRMIEGKVGSIFIIESARILGIFTERDLMRRVTLEGLSPREVPVRSVMTENVVYVEPNTTTMECLAIMTHQRCRHLPVMEGGKAVGVISIGDCVKQLSADQHMQVRLLTDYITSKYPG